MKNLSFKQRIVNLWDYYRYHALIVIFCIVFFCYFLSPLLATKKHDLLSIAIIDSTQTAKEDCSALSDDLTSLLGGNTKYDAVHIDTSGTTYDTSSSSTIKLSILLSSVGENDIVIVEKSYMKNTIQRVHFQMPVISATVPNGCLTATQTTPVSMPVFL